MGHPMKKSCALNVRLLSRETDEDERLEKISSNRKEKKEEGEEDGDGEGDGEGEGEEGDGEGEKKRIKCGRRRCWRTTVRRGEPRGIHSAQRQNGPRVATVSFFFFSLLVSGQKKKKRESYGKNKHTTTRVKGLAD